MRKEREEREEGGDRVGRRGEGGEVRRVKESARDQEEWARSDEGDNSEENLILCTGTCGDNFCDKSNETCSSCPADCGHCRMFVLCDCACVLRVCLSSLRHLYYICKYVS